MPFEHHGEGTWYFPGHPEHVCGPSRCGRAALRRRPSLRALGAIVCDPYFIQIHKHRWLITKQSMFVQHTILALWCSEGTWSFQGLARLDVWHVWASCWTPGRAWTSWNGHLGVWQRLAASGRLGVWHFWPAVRSGRRLADAW
jgi:hypothetical protein